MFGSVTVVAKDKKSKKDKKDKKEDKKEKKEDKKRKKKEKRRKRDKKAKADSSSGSSSRSSSAGRDAAGPVQQQARGAAGWMGSEDDFMKALLGEDHAAEHKPREQPQPRPPKRRTMDTADLFAAGLQGRFAPASGQARSFDSVEGSAAQTAPPRAEGSMLQIAGAMLEDVVDADGCFEGTFVPEHLRRGTTVEKFRAMLSGADRGGGGKRRKKDGKKTADKYAPYEGIENLLKDKKNERAQVGLASQARDKTAFRGAGSLIAWDTPEFSKENVISLAERTLLMLPVFAPITPGQCYLTTIEPRHSELDFDDEEQTEIRNFKKCLIQMCAESGYGVVFSETVLSVGRQQTYIDCIPVPLEKFEDIEVYFYKAIDEAENEFEVSSRRVLRTRGKQLKAVLPQGLPYYNVSFGLDGGYAHVIANAKSFPKHLTVTVCANLLGVGMGGRLSKAERDRLLGPDARTTFRQNWDKHDWTKMLDIEEGAEEEENPAPTAEPDGSGSERGEGATPADRREVGSGSDES
ncbi:CWF19-like protein 2-like protein [Diplonema papillatum]|nr:CWF19-like protein 2-like protein [Diplonema papillatum]